MAQSNIYAQKENGDLRLIAEVEGETDPALAVDALLDEMPRLKQRQFIVIDLDNVMSVEAGDEIVQPRRQITITNGANVGRATSEPEPEEDDEEATEESEGGEEQEEEAPKPTRRSRSRGKSEEAPKRRSRTRNSGGGSRRRGKSPLKPNPASAE